MNPAGMGRPCVRSCWGAVLLAAALLPMAPALRQGLPPSLEGAAEAEAARKSHGQTDGRARRMVGSSVVQGSARSTVDVFTVNLTLPASQRWSEVVEHFREPMMKLFRSMQEELEGLLGSWGFVGKWVLGRFAAAMSDYDIDEEICGIAKLLSVDCDNIRLVQILYEIYAACTSIAVQLPKGPALVRTMDWEEPLLRELTATFRFVGGPWEFTASSWAGYVGVLTGSRPAGPGVDGAAVSVNFRRVSADDQAVYKTAMFKILSAYRGGMPVGFLVRKALGDHYYPSLSGVMDLLGTQKLVAPVYFTVAGVQPKMQTLLDHYATNYNEFYSPSGLMCCCKAPGSCALVSGPDLVEVDSKAAKANPLMSPGGYACPVMDIDGKGPVQLSEDKAGCAGRPAEVAPCTLQAREIAVITRGTSMAEQIRRSRATVEKGVCKPLASARKFLIQTNHDDFAPIVDGAPMSPEGASQDIFDSLDRLKRTVKYMKESPPLQQGAAAIVSKLDEEEFLFSLISLEHVLSEHTVYGTAMRPAVGSLQTRLPWPCHKKKRGQGLCFADETLAYDKGYEISR